MNDTLNAFDQGETRTPTLVVENHPADSRVKVSSDGVVQTLSSRMGTGGGNTPLVIGECKSVDCSHADDVVRVDDIVPCMQGRQSQGGNNVLTMALNDQGGSQMSVSEEMTSTLRSEEHGHQPCVKNNAVVRRLTPMECERLQGYPDGWTDIGEWTDTKGKKHKEADSPRYKALGNSIALPFWSWMAERMVNVLKADGIEKPTMASLFDGIGGFPLVYSRHGAEPVWASEIEEFPIAVTKIRFPEGK